MTKQRHIHVLTATVHIALEYDPANLLEAGNIQAQMQVAAQKLPGFRSIQLGTGKIPAPPEAPAVIVEPLIPADDLEIPAALRRK